MKELRGDWRPCYVAVSEDGPYVLVGTSGGGFLMAGFAYAHPNDVIGKRVCRQPETACYALGFAGDRVSSSVTVLGMLHTTRRSDDGPSFPLAGHVASS